jgi:L-ascorbate metabolism protein UlaG (beta-lactamase superfamily)
MKHALIIACLLLAIPGCVVTRVLGRSFTVPVEPKRIEGKVTHPERADARLAVLWVGHATVLIQMDDRYILTDPVFTRTVGELSPRLVEPGIAPSDLPPISVAAISHAHFDHLSFDSLAMIEDKIQVLLMPPETRHIMPRYDFEMVELELWQSTEVNGVRVTAVPVRHVGGRFGIDAAFSERAFTGYVFEYHGLRVYFGGDSAYSTADFRATRDRFKRFDLALLPICPTEPRDFMQFTHMDPAEALGAFELLGADRMIPIHFDTFINGDDRPGECSLRLLSEMSRRNVDLSRVSIMRIGEQRVLMKRESRAVTTPRRL